jgi:hypothetical protein
MMVKKEIDKVGRTRRLKKNEDTVKSRKAEEEIRNVGRDHGRWMTAH